MSSASRKSGKEWSTDHIRRGVHYRRSDQDVDQLALAADIILETKDAEFPAHSSILGLNSSFFCDMFADWEPDHDDDGGGGGGAGGAKPKNVIRLQEETRDVKKLLQFMYDRHASKQGVDLATALRLLATAHKYGVPSLEELSLARVLEFWPQHADGKVLVHEQVQDALGCRHSSLHLEYAVGDEFDVFTWWRIAKQVAECAGMLNRCKSILAILVASKALVNLNKCYSDNFMEEYEENAQPTSDPRSDMCLLLFSEIPKLCAELEVKGIGKDDCLEITWMVSWLLRSVKENEIEGTCCICRENPTPTSDIRICALCPTKLRPFWW